MTSPESTLPGELLDRLAARAMAATTLAELAFSLANDAYPLLGFRQALVFDAAGSKEQEWLLM